jgi:hypothetical protein
VKLAQIIRISVALALIFAAGLITGRYTAPGPPVTLGPGGRGPDTIMARLTTELELDAGQKAKLKEIIDDLSEQMVSFPPASPERRDLFRSAVPRMRKILRPDQYAAFDRYVESTQKRFNRAIRRRDTSQQSPVKPR